MKLRTLSRKGLADWHLMAVHLEREEYDAEYVMSLVVELITILDAMQGVLINEGDILDEHVRE